MPMKVRSAAEPAGAGTRRSAYDARRGSACSRGYGRRWEKLRKLILARDPLCMVRANLPLLLSLRPGEREKIVLMATRLCAGDRPSTDADHIIPKSLGGEDYEENLQGACHECHSVKTSILDN
jgi:5-methylcytosine-specific restriction protein A